jgi:hypothetical protein
MSGIKERTGGPSGCSGFSPPLEKRSPSCTRSTVWNSGASQIIVINLQHQQEQKQNKNIGYLVKITPFVFLGEVFSLASSTSDASLQQNKLYQSDLKLGHVEYMHQNRQRSTNFKVRVPGDPLFLSGLYTANLKLPINI